MSLPLPDHLAAALEARDPAARYRAAASALDALSAALDGIQTAAALELVAAHGGNASAAGRELRFKTPQGFQQWLARRTDPAGGPAPAAPRSQEQPALRFADQDAALTALDDYLLDLQQVEDRREPLVLGALAAGLTPEAIYRAAGIPPAVTARLRPAEIEVAADLEAPAAFAVLEETGRALTGHAEALRESARAAGGGKGDPQASGAARIWTQAARAFVHHVAPGALLPPETPHTAALRRAYQEVIDARRAELHALHPETDEDQVDELLRTEEPSPALVAAETAYFEAQQEQDREFNEQHVDTGTAPTHLSADAWLAAQIAAYDRLAASYEKPDRYCADKEHAALMDGLAAGYRQVSAAFRHLRTTAAVPPLPTLLPADAR
ncbi:hypothetical protein [Kitasatospora griseola]|uniref:hypothetical protein n=1 Tax=Kitasatospora griseola TaxID=2064 RepID=UPI0034130333